jgi:hypothetical protein
LALAERINCITKGFDNGDLSIQTDVIVTGTSEGFAWMTMKAVKIHISQVDGHEVNKWMHDWARKRDLTMMRSSMK